MRTIGFLLQKNPLASAGGVVRAAAVGSADLSLTLMACNCKLGGGIGNSAVGTLAASAIQFLIAYSLNRSVFLKSSRWECLVLAVHSPI